MPLVSGIWFSVTRPIRYFTAKACANSAVRRPMYPRPITPNFLPLISMPGWSIVFISTIPSHVEGSVDTATTFNQNTKRKLSYGFSGVVGNVSNRDAFASCIGCINTAVPSTKHADIYFRFGNMSIVFLANLGASLTSKASASLLSPISMLLAISTRFPAMASSSLPVSYPSSSLPAKANAQ